MAGTRLGTVTGRPCAITAGIETANCDSKEQYRESPPPASPTKVGRLLSIQVIDIAKQIYRNVTQANGMETADSLVRAPTPNLFAKPVDSGMWEETDDEKQSITKTNQSFPHP